MLMKTLESSLDCKEIKTVNPKGNQPWILTRRTVVEAEAPMLWPPDVKNWLIRKAPDAGKAWRQEEKGRTEDEMVGWHRWLDAREFEQAVGVGSGQRSLACCSPWGCKKSDTTERLNWLNWNATDGASPVVLVVKDLRDSAGDTGNVGSIPGSGRSPGGGHGHLRQYSCLKNPMDRGAWRATSIGLQGGHDWSDTCCWWETVLSSTYKHFWPQMYVFPHISQFSKSLSTK